ncbi:sulfotransferase domain-containing protein [uncultured Desulfobacter sp.]|uniref:sulfotransferase domain-containing protein n=1 Tax=uncultured Desulfobacter sp. TaxID=240139 RepID=UPI0029F462C4|nr:sulfotransferase domain-containing protein [uncultured Desulfobacter sp.]
MKKKIAIVAYSHGREGTSVLMGILKCLYYEVPDKVKPSKMNPKGFFEDPDFDQLVFECYGRENGDLSWPPSNVGHIKSSSTSVRTAKREAFFAEFEKIIASNPKYALKAPRYLLVPLIEKYTGLYDIKIIHIVRNEKDHINSIFRVWQTTPNIEKEKKVFKKKAIRDWVKAWKEFGSIVLEETPYPILRLSFESLINDQEKSIKMIADFLEESSISVNIFGWIEPKLVNRRKLKI